MGFLSDLFNKKNELATVPPSKRSERNELLVIPQRIPGRRYVNGRPLTPKFGTPEWDEYERMVRERARASRPPEPDEYEEVEYTKIVMKRRVKK